MLDEVNVVQPVPDRGVLRRGRMRLDRPPVFRVGPDLVSVEIAKQWVHDDRIICNVSRAGTRNHWETRVARRLQFRPGMDASDFDRLVARARDPRLIHGIYNYCDGRCPRCPFTARCLTYLDSQELKAERGGDSSLADAVGDSLQRTLEILAEAARREGIDLDALAEEATAASAEEDDLARHREDPLVVRAREYGQLAWRIGRAIAPIAAARDDGRLVEAVETIEWFSSMISSKLYRAVCGQAEGWEGRDDTQTDFNGSAKVALARDRRIAACVGGADGGGPGVGGRGAGAGGEDARGARRRGARAFSASDGFVRPGFDGTVHKESPT